MLFRSAASSDFVAAHLERTASDLERALRAHCARGAANPTLLIVCPSGRQAAEVDSLVAATERQIATRLQGFPGLRVVLAADFHEHYRVADADIADSLRDHIGHIPYRDGYFHVLGTIVMRHVHRAVAPVRKVVAVDADNTLWGGVVGEIGQIGRAHV